MNPATATTMTQTHTDGAAALRGGGFAMQGGQNGATPFASFLKASALGGDAGHGSLLPLDANKAAIGGGLSSNPFASFLRMGADGAKGDHPLADLSSLDFGFTPGRKSVAGSIPLLDRSGLENVAPAELLAESKDSPVEQEKEHQKLQKQAQRLVAQTFYGTLLKQMRNSPFRSKLFDGGRGGEAFNQLFDQHLVDQMSRSSGKKLVANIVRKLEAKKAYAQKEMELPAKLPTTRSSGIDGQNADPKVRMHVSPAFGS